MFKFFENDCFRKFIQKIVAVNKPDNDPKSIKKARQRPKKYKKKLKKRENVQVCGNIPLNQIKLTNLQKDFRVFLEHVFFFI